MKPLYKIGSILFLKSNFIKYTSYFRINKIDNYFKLVGFEKCSHDTCIYTYLNKRNICNGKRYIVESITDKKIYNMCPFFICYNNKDGIYKNCNIFEEFEEFITEEEMIID